MLTDPCSCVAKDVFQSRGSRDYHGDEVVDCVLALLLSTGFVFGFATS